VRPRVVLVTDPAYPDDVVDRAIRDAARAIEPGGFAVQLRARGAAPAAFAARAKELRALTRGEGALLVVNGDSRLARDVGADGVHLGGAWSVHPARAVVGAGAWISVAAHDDGDVARAAAEGADAALVSPIFATPGEGKGAPRGVSALARAAELARRAVASSAGVADERAAPRRAPLAVIALGGVTEHNAASCRDAGATGVALIRGLLASGRPGDVARAIDCAFAALW